MNAAERLLIQSARWLVIVLALGALLRSAFVWLYNPAPFLWSDLIHAHSHTAYFGWAGLALMALMLHLLPRVTGEPVAAPGAVRWLLRLAPWAVGGALVAFALEGYGPFSIALSVLNEALWYLFAYIFWQCVKRRPIREWPPALWLMGTAVALLLLSTAGTLLVMLTSVIFPVDDPVLAGSGIYLFLQAYGDGWLEVGLMGVAAALLGGLPDRRLARWQAVLLLVLTAPASLRLLVPFGLSGWPVWLGILSGLGLAVAQALFLINIARSPGHMPEAVRPWWGLAGAALVVKIALEALPLLPGWEAWAGERQLVIAYLHLKLLLLVTAGLIGALGYVTGVGRGWTLFASGALVMVGALAAHGLWTAAVPALSRPLFGVAFVAAIIAALGGAMAVWPTAVGRASPSPAVPKTAETYRRGPRSG